MLFQTQITNDKLNPYAILPTEQIIINAKNIQQSHPASQDFFWVDNRKCNINLITKLSIEIERKFL